MRPLSPSTAQWYFSPEVLENTPSRDDGMSLEHELKKRKTGIGYIISLGLRAGLDRNGHAMRSVILTAATFLHRFYMRRSMSDVRLERAAAAILFLASKTEEAPLKLRHVASAAAGKFDLQPISERNEHVSEEMQKQAHAKWEKTILHTEEIVLEALCFDLVVEQPWGGVVKGLRAVMAVGAGALVNESRNAKAGPSTRAVKQEEKPVAQTDGEDGEAAVPASTTTEEGPPATAMPEDDVDMAEPETKPAALVAAVPETEVEETFDARDWAFKEDEMLETGMVLLNEIYVTPLPILSVPPILSVAILVLAISILTQHPTEQTRRYLYGAQPRYRVALCDALKLQLERGQSNLKFATEDADLVDACLKQFEIYLARGLIDPKLRALLPSSSPAPAAAAVSADA